MNKRAKPWLVVGTDELIITTPGFRGSVKGLITKIGCVWAESEDQACLEGAKLFGCKWLPEDIHAIPLPEIKPGWIYGEGD